MRRLPFLIGLLTLLGASVPATAFPWPPPRDRHGDPLPTGAMVRLGTSRLRADCTTLHFSADGKALFGVGARAIRTWNAADGSLRETRRLTGTTPQRNDLSADGRTLVASDLISSDTGRRAARPIVELWDVPTATPIRMRLPRDIGSIDGAAISNDRRWFLLVERGVPPGPAFAGGGRVVHLPRRLILWDSRTSTSRILAEAETGLVWLSFSPDGNRIVTSGESGTRVYDTAAGKQLWEIRGFNAEEAHFTLDNKHVIASPGGGQSAWHVRDADTGRPSRDLRPPTIGYAWMFAVSPDGSMLLIPTETDYVVWDLKAGAVRYRWPGALQSGRGVFAPDGRSVVTYDTVLHRRDLGTGKDLYADVSNLGHTAPVRRVFFDPSGMRLVSVGADRTARVWDVPGARQVRSIPLESPGIDAWAVTPDAATLLGIDERLTVHRWPLTSSGPRTTAALRDAQKLGIGLRARDLRVAPDGTLAVLAWPRSPEYRLNRFSFSFWDAATGRLERWGGDPGQDYRGDSTRLSPDGRHAATMDAVYDTRTGSRQVIPGSPFGIGGPALFSPDGRLLAASSRDIRVWEVATGKVLVDLPGGSTDQAAFSSDGRRLASLTVDRLTIWDIASRVPIASWPIPDVPVAVESWVTGGMAFSPDGRMLATGHADGTILLWPVPNHPVEGRWTEGEGVALWNDLGDETPANAFPAIWQLADHPADAVRLLREKYPLAPTVAPDDWARWIAALDSPRFLHREAASKRLSVAGRAAERPLREALKAKLSAEQVQRIETLLSALDSPGTRPRGDDLRAVRAVAVLETCGTAEARQLLADWAERGVMPRLGEEARRAVDRLRSRPVHP